MSIIERAVERLQQARTAPTTKEPVERTRLRSRDSEVGEVEGTPATPPVPPPVQVAATGQNRRQVKLDFDQLRRLGFAVPGERGHLAEEYRLIKRPLLLKAFAANGEKVKNGHLIMVTSAEPRAGKTFTAINLALSMAAERDITVLLIDADVANPCIPRLLGFDSERGLTDVLADPHVDLAEVMVRTNLENLSLLPAGSSHLMVNELFASSRMSQFVDDVAARYNNRVIMIDAPPVLAKTDPSVLALHVGQVVFVVQATRTSVGALQDALRELGACKDIGLILNKVTFHPQRCGLGRYLPDN